MIKRFQKYFMEDLWKIRVSVLSPLAALCIQTLRVLVLTLRFFFHNRCMLHAASLTYYTLLAIVPILALAFGITKGYGFDKILKKRLMEVVSLNGDFAARIMEFAESAIENASGGIVAGVGVLLLGWTAIKLLAGIEGAFNGIWGVKQGRAWSRKCCDYLTLFVVFPFLLVVVASTSNMVVNRLEAYLMYGMSGILVKAINILSVCSIFVFIYMFIPNTKVRLKTGIISGLVIGIAYMVLQALYVVMQSGLTSYNAIYGSFAALPIFLILLNFSWTLIIFGAQLSFAIQNVSSYELEPEYGSAVLCQSRRRSCAMAILNLLIWRFNACRGGMAAAEISARLRIPIRTTRSVIFELCNCGFLSMVQDDDKNGGEYCQVAMPPAEITPLAVFTALDKSGVDLLSMPEDDDKFSIYSEALWSNPDILLNRPLGSIEPPGEC